MRGGAFVFGDGTASMEGRPTLELLRDLVDPRNQWMRIPRCGVVTEKRTFLYDTENTLPIRTYPLWTAEQRARADKEVFGEEGRALKHHERHSVAILVHGRDMPIWWTHIGVHLVSGDVETIEQGMYYHYSITPEEYRKKHGLRKKDMREALRAREEEARRQFEMMRMSTPEEYAKKVQKEGLASVEQISADAAGDPDEYLHDWAHWARRPENFSVFDELRYDE